MSICVVLWSVYFNYYIFITGSLLLEQNNNVTLSNTVVGGSKASAGTGGGITLTVGNHLYLKDVNISGNMCGSIGGGIMVQGASYVEFAGRCIIANNRALYAGGGVASVNSPLWSVLGNGSVLLDGNEASTGGALFYKGLLESDQELHNVTFSNNTATVGGIIYWLYDSSMTEEPPGVRSSSIVWIDNVAPYGLQLGTQAMELIGPSSYEVTVYGTELSPPLTFHLQDYYGERLPLDGTTAVIAAVGSYIECNGEPASLAGENMFGNGVVMVRNIYHMFVVIGYYTRICLSVLSS